MTEKKPKPVVVDEKTCGVWSSGREYSCSELVDQHDATRHIARSAEGHLLADWPRERQPFIGGH